MATAAPEGERVLGEATLAELRAQILGSVITPGDRGYRRARRIWNHVIDKHPAVIVGCSSAADVITAVRFARSEGLPVAVRGGSHSIAGFSTCDGGMVLDLSQMAAVRVDARSGRALGSAEKALSKRERTRS